MERESGVPDRRSCRTGATRSSSSCRYGTEGGAHCMESVRKALSLGLGRRPRSPLRQREPRLGGWNMRLRDAHRRSGIRGRNSKTARRQPRSHRRDVTRRNGYQGMLRRSKGNDGGAGATRRGRVCRWICFAAVPPMTQLATELRNRRGNRQYLTRPGVIVPIALLSICPRDRFWLTWAPLLGDLAC